jgi:hypothetical protein
VTWACAQSDTFENNPTRRHPRDLRAIFRYPCLNHAFVGYPWAVIGATTRLKDEVEHLSTV